MSLNTRIKNLRLLRKLSQQQMADQLYMSRSAYTKLEAKAANIRIELLQRIAAVLQVPATLLVATSVGSVDTAGGNEFDFMLDLAYNYLALDLTVVPYEELTLDQLALMTSKGYGSREAYEDTPLQGRLYTYGPRLVIRTMLREMQMATLFEHHLIQDPSWLRHWEDFQRFRVTPGAYAEPEVDETAYLLVFLLTLTMPDGSKRHLELAQRDIPEGMDEEDALQQLLATHGATDGDIMAMTYDGYTTRCDIVTDIYAA